MKKPLLWVLILVMSISLVAFFSSTAGCRAKPEEKPIEVEEEVVEEETEEEPVVEEVTGEPEESPGEEEATTSSALTGTINVHFIDVGQGDSIFIDLGSEEVLIDGGEKSPGGTDYISQYIDGPLEVIGYPSSY